MMAECPKCNRALPPNGRCLYCGDYETERRERPRASGAGAMIRRGIFLVFLAGVILGIGYLVATDEGRAWARKTLRLEETSDDPPAIDAVRRNAPGLKKLEEGRPGSLQFVQEPRDEENTQVTVLYQEGAKLTQGSFLVHLPSGSVTALDRQAEQWMEN